jgi:hypothetical protein
LPNVSQEAQRVSRQVAVPLIAGTRLIDFQRTSEFGVLPPGVFNCYHHQAACSGTRPCKKSRRPSELSDHGGGFLAWR